MKAFMSRLRPLLERNRAFAATGAQAGLAIMPRQQVFLVTCLDPRVDPAAFLGVGLGDAPVIRNAAKLPPQISVSGHVYDLQTGLVTTVVGPGFHRDAEPAAGRPPR